MAEIYFEDVITLSIDLSPILADLGLVATDITEFVIKFKDNEETLDALQIRRLSDSNIAIDTTASLLKIPFTKTDYSTLPVRDDPYIVSWLVRYTSDGFDGERTIENEELTVLPRNLNP